MGFPNYCYDMYSQLCANLFIDLNSFLSLEMWPMDILIVYQCKANKAPSIDEQRKPFQVCEFEYMKFWTSEGQDWGLNPYLEINYMIGSKVMKEAEVLSCESI